MKNNHKGRGKRRPRPLHTMGLVSRVKALHQRFKWCNWWLDADTAVTLAQIAGKKVKS